MAFNITQHPCHPKRLKYLSLKYQDISIIKLNVYSCTLGTKVCLGTFDCLETLAYRHQFALQSQLFPSELGAS